MRVGDAPANEQGYDLFNAPKCWKSTVLWFHIKIAGSAMILYLSPVVCVCGGGEGVGGGWEEKELGFYYPAVPAVWHI